MKRFARALPFLASAAWACSGEGAEEAISLSGRIGGVSGLLSMALTVFIVAKKPKWWVRGVAIALSVFHPAWWMSALHGDCGYSLRLAAPVMAAVHVGIALIVWRQQRQVSASVPS